MVRLALNTGPFWKVPAISAHSGREMYFGPKWSSAIFPYKQNKKIKIKIKSHLAEVNRGVVVDLVALLYKLG